MEPHARRNHTASGGTLRNERCPTPSSPAGSTTCRTRRPGFYDNSGDDVASYLLNLTNLDHVVDRAGCCTRPSGGQARRLDALGPREVRGRGRGDGRGRAAVPGVCAAAFYFSRHVWARVYVRIADLGHTAPEVRARVYHRFYILLHGARGGAGRGALPAEFPDVEAAALRAGLRFDFSVDALGGVPTTVVYSDGRLRVHADLAFWDGPR